MMLVKIGDALASAKRAGRRVPRYQGVRQALVAGRIEGEGTTWVEVESFVRWLDAWENGGGQRREQSPVEAMEALEGLL